MRSICHRMKWLSLILLLFAFGPVEMSEGSERNRKVLNPKEYASPSGEYRLRVDPSDRHGAGEAKYRMTFQGKEVWSGKRPFTLWQAAVNDDGGVAGYAYSEGPYAIQRLGDLRVILLDAQGKTRLEQVTQREPSRFFHQNANPQVNDLIVDPANDRMIVRIRGADLNRPEEIWWVYRLSTAQPTASLAPNSLLKAKNKKYFLLDAQLVPGTPLTFLHWWISTNRIDDNEKGVLFTLIDANGAQVWSRPLPGDPTPGRKGAGGKANAGENLKDCEILDVSRKNQFTLRFSPENQSVTFEINHSADGSWAVKEIGRKPFVPAPVV